MHAAVRGPVVALGAAAALALLPGTAAADVTVAASRAEAGARNVTVTFRVTNPDPAVPTTRLEVSLPTVHPLLGVRPTPPTGWTAQVRTARPAAPLTVDGAPVAEIPTTVTWAGGTLAGAGYAVFPIDVERLPDGAGPLRFRVVQTFASGATEEWSDLVPYGAPAPAHPALEVPYSASAPLPPAPEGHHHGDASDVVLPPARHGASGWFAGLAAAAAALVAAGVTALGRRQRRRIDGVLQHHDVEHRDARERA
jgi:uncharacterized protein YcnI